MMKTIATVLILASLFLNAAIFGFFYTWVCSTMWGLDNADPGVAIQAMQAMNASVRNIVFAPAFFATPVVSLVTAYAVWRMNTPVSAVLFAASAAIYFCFGLLLTITINVPMNEALASVAVPADIETARRIWQEYSEPWQFWNQSRTVATGLSFVLAACGALNYAGSNGHPNVP